MEKTKVKQSELFKKDFAVYGQILHIEFSPFILSQDLILIGFESKIVLGHLKIDVSILL